MTEIKIKIEKVGKGYIFSYDITGPGVSPCFYRDVFLNADELVGRATKAIQMFFDWFKSKEEE